MRLLGQSDLYHGTSIELIQNHSHRFFVCSVSAQPDKMVYFLNLKDLNFIIKNKKIPLNKGFSTFIFDYKNQIIL